MFDKILIANRGEIACRIIDTCGRMGVRTVAVFSDVDRGARHVHMADEAIPLGGHTPAESYLRMDAVIEAATRTGAQAIHPGYGFLSENPDFVEKVVAAGLVFIGPSADAIRAMGLKDAAKALMQKSNVPVVPGYHGVGQDDLAARAAEIGYPVLIKAVAGGGGKGMRRVDDEAEFENALDAARSEAAKAFGNDAVLIEKFVTQPRHIEVQVFGDGTDAVHLFERDCSLQRRHQKVIEEAPAPGMTPEMRAAMGQAACRAAQAVGYAGAGTVEFIVDASDGLREDRFYFMEMNTRLQVEHPVTEEITGVDLVEWQLRVASGAPLPMTQEDLQITGHAFEARIYAEDVPAGFLPATGTLHHLTFADNARIDTGVRQGDEISTFYDPMIAKLTVHGADRADALARLDRALSATQIAGTVTNIAFLRALAGHAGFAAGEVDTGLIERDLAMLNQPAKPCSRTIAIAAITALNPVSHPHQGFTLWDSLRQTASLEHGDEVVAAHVSPVGGDIYQVEVKGASHRVENKQESWHVDGVKVTAQTASLPGEVAVFWGNSYFFDIPDPLSRAGGASDGGDATLAPMPGLVRSVFVAPGEEVQEGDRLLVLEAMKMEHVLKAARAGVIAAVNVAEGSQIAAGDILVALEPEESAP